MVTIISKPAEHQRHMARLPRLAASVAVWLAACASAQPGVRPEQPQPTLPAREPFVLPPKPIGADPTPALPRSGREVDLRPRFRVGEPIWYRLVQTSNSTMTSNGADRVTESVQEVELRFEAVHADPEAKTTTVEATIERVRMTLKADGQVTSHDTGPVPPGRRASRPTTPATPGRPAPAITPPSWRKPVAPAGQPPEPQSPKDPQPDALDDVGRDVLADLLAPMVGSKTTFVLDRDGNITSMSGGTGLDLGSLTGGGVGGLGVAGPSQFGQIICPAPGRASAGTGDSWTTTSDLVSSPIGGVSMTTRWNVTDVARGVANLKFTGSLASRSQDASLLRISDLTYSGTARWNAERGELANMTSDMTMVAETSLTGSPTRIKSRASTAVTPLE